MTKEIGLIMLKFKANIFSVYRDINIFNKYFLIVHRLMLEIHFRILYTILSRKLLKKIIQKIIIENEICDQIRYL